MTLEQQRIAIAEACGWEVVQGDDELLVHRQGEAFCHQFPDYLNDLNAMHDAEKTLTDQQFTTYANLLWRTGYAVKTAVCAHAPQRAEAFLKTLNLWKD